MFRFLLNLFCFGILLHFEAILLILESFSNELTFKDNKLDNVKIHVDSDKAKSAKIKIDEWNIQKDDITVIVDGANDVKLFDICELGIAYRAQDLVKDLATVSLDEKDLSKIIPIINSHYKLKIPLQTA